MDIKPRGPRGSKSVEGQPVRLPAPSNTRAPETVPGRQLSSADSLSNKVEGFGVLRKKKGLGVVVLIGVIILLAATLTLAVLHLTAPVRIGLVSLQSEGTSTTQERDTFREVESVTATIHYSSAKEGVAVSAEIHRDERRAVRTLSLPTLRQKGSNKTTGIRRVALSGGAVTRLKPGEYTLYVKNGDQVLAKKPFTITGR